MEIELPKRIAEAGAEHHVDKINNTCRLTVMRLVKQDLEDEYNDALRDPVFGPILAMNEHQLGYSGKRNDKGFWGTLLKRNGEVDMKTIRLKHFKECKDWSRVDRVRLVYLCVICFVMAKDEKINIPHAYIRLVMDFDKMRKYPWGLHAYDMLLDSIKKARFKLKQNSYVLDGFSYALQIWLMEAIPDIGTLLGRKYKEGITSVVFPFISDTGNNDVIAGVKFKRDDEKKDERVDKILSLVNAKFDWSKFIWQVEEDIPTQDQLDRKVDVPVEESQVQIDEKDEIAVEGELAVSENEEPVESVAKRRVTRKAKDPGCESRKRQLLCQRAAEQNTGLDDQTKNFMTGLFNTSFNSMKEEVKKHMDHRFDMLDSEIAQLKQTVAASIVSRNDVPASERPQPSAMPSPHPKRKDENLDDVEMHDFHGNLHNVSVSQSSNIDLEMGTQDYLWKTMGNLTQDSYVKGFDPSQKAKVDDPMEWEIQIVTFNVYKRYVSTYSWTYRVKVIRIFQEIDAMLFLFRERTTLRRWKANRVAFMSCVFNNHMKCSYATFTKDKTKFKVEGLLHDYGTDVEPFANLIPRIVKDVQSAENKKHLNVRTYKVVYVPVPFINKSSSDCGVYSLKFINVML
ncbi:hypothetical protein Bca4012_088516 [Brassica carinata]|uniref:Ubiquitin-like protease family profile domain-containing protein n=1 Tax=Brassica oleracea TaxID=3712 RepID=A0A3P6FXE7_BRAOL|nr:unnamed protein product [Brassica oleracea]